MFKSSKFVFIIQQNCWIGTKRNWQTRESAAAISWRQQFNRYFKGTLLEKHSLIYYLVWHCFYVFLDVEVNICFKYDNCPGVIPEEIGNLHNLIEIVMESNNLSGSIPLNIFNITSLQTLSFTSNKLSGPIPRELGRLASIQKLQLGNKRYFTGMYWFFNHNK